MSRRKMTKAEKKAVSERMRKFHAERRAAKARVAQDAKRAAEAGSPIPAIRTYAVSLPTAIAPMFFGLIASSFPQVTFDPENKIRIEC